MIAIRRNYYRARRLAGRAAHAWDLWYRLGFPIDHAWRIAGTWH